VGTWECRRGIGDRAARNVRIRYSPLLVAGLPRIPRPRRSAGACKRSDCYRAPNRMPRGWHGHGGGPWESPGDLLG